MYKVLPVPQNATLDNSLAVFQRLDRNRILANKPIAELATRNAFKMAAWPWGRSSVGA